MFTDFLYDIATKERERLSLLAADAVYEVMRKSGLKYGRKEVLNALLDNGFFDKLKFKDASGMVLPYVHPNVIIPVLDDVAIAYPLFVIGAGDKVYGNAAKAISKSRADNFSISEALEMYKRVLERDLKKVIGKRNYNVSIIPSDVKLTDMLFALTESKGNKKKFRDRMEYLDGGRATYVFDIEKDKFSGDRIQVFYRPIIDEARVVDRAAISGKTYSRLTWDAALAIVKELVR